MASASACTSVGLDRLDAHELVGVGRGPRPGRRRADRNAWPAASPNSRRGERRASTASPQPPGVPARPARTDAGQPRRAEPVARAPRGRVRSGPAPRRGCGAARRAAGEPAVRAVVTTCRRDRRGASGLGSAGCPAPVLGAASSDAAARGSCRAVLVEVPATSWRSSSMVGSSTSRAAARRGGRWRPPGRCGRTVRCRSCPPVGCGRASRGTARRASGTSS